MKSNRKIDGLGLTGIESTDFFRSRLLPVTGRPDAVVGFAVKTFEAVSSTSISDVGDNAIILVIVDFDHRILQWFMVGIRHYSCEVTQRMLSDGRGGVLSESRGRAKPEARCNRHDDNLSPGAG